MGNEISDVLQKIKDKMAERKPVLIEGVPFYLEQFDFTYSKLSNHVIEIRCKHFVDTEKRGEQ